MACAGRDLRRWIFATWRGGRYDGFWEFNLNSWDTAAGVLLVKEAGGTVTNFSGGGRSQSIAARSWPRMAHSIRKCCENLERLLRDALEGLPSVAEYLKS